MLLPHNWSAASTKLAGTLKAGRHARIWQAMCIWPRWYWLNSWAATWHGSWSAGLQNGGSTSLDTLSYQGSRQHLQSCLHLFSAGRHIRGQLSRINQPDR